MGHVLGIVIAWQRAFCWRATSSPTLTYFPLLSSVFATCTRFRFSRQFAFYPFPLSLSVDGSRSPCHSVGETRHWEHELSTHRRRPEHVFTFVRRLIGDQVEKSSNRHRRRVVTNFQINSSVIKILKSCVLSSSFLPRRKKSLSVGNLSPTWSHLFDGVRVLLCSV